MSEEYKIAYENVLIANNMLRQENEQLKKKLDKAIELLIASEYKQFLINEKGKETIKECWLRYIEQELEK